MGGFFETKVGESDNLHVNLHQQTVEGNKVMPRLAQATVMQ